MPGWVWIGAPGVDRSVIPGFGVPAAQAGDRDQVSGCDPSYSPCVPIDPELTCADLGYPVALLGRADPLGLDTDNDGIGCERDQSG